MGRSHGAASRPLAGWPLAAGLVLLAVALVWLLLQPRFPWEPPPAEPTAWGVARVVHVSDGDTLDVVRGGVRERVRLLGIDAPELAHDGRPEECGAAAAREALAALSLDHDATVAVDPAVGERDRYGRLLGYVEVAGADVARLLVERGVVGAWSPAGSPAHARAADYEALAAAARAGRVGSWAGCERLGR